MLERYRRCLEQARLITTEESGPRANLQGRARQLEEEAAWIGRYRRLWAAHFDELDKIVEELKRREKADKCRKRK